MSATTSYQPFLIGDGQYKSGLFQYLQSWVKPGDAFDVLQDAYIYRGSLYKRNGSTLYPSVAGKGSLVYADSSKIGNIAVAFQTTRNQSSSGSVTIPILPIIAGDTILYARTSAGVESWADNGAGVLTGSLGDTGTINYTNGNWSLTLSGGRTFNNPTEIWATYSYAPKYVTTGGPFSRPIMGIKNFIQETNNSQVLVVLDTRRASFYDPSAPTFEPINTFSQILGIGDGASNPQTFTASWTNITPFTVSISDGSNTITDLGDGTLTTAGNMVGPNTINYTTGAISLGLTAANSNTYTISGTLNGDYFTGNNTNFFNATNWKPTDTATGYLYLTNNVDPVTTFDGTNLSRLAYPITLAHSLSYTNDIKTTLDIKVYKNRLLFLRPFIVGASSPEAQTIRWSAIFSPQNFVADVTGNGGSLQAPTSDWIFAAQFLRDMLVVFFQNSTWLFRFTTSAFDPFRFDQVNNSRSTNAPYASAPYDLFCTSSGNKGLIYCDGNNVDRYDEKIIDQFLEIEPDAFAQCFTQKFDSLNQTWMLYPEVDTGSGTNIQATSDKILIYNFLEETWAIYKLPLSCLGLGKTTTDLEWEDFAANSGSEGAGKTWAQWSYPWAAYQNMADQPALLGGDQLGFVYELDVGNTDNGTAIFSDILSKRFNPFAPTGEKATYGYLDVYYNIAPTVTLTFDFYLNDSSAIDFQRALTLDGNANQAFAWKRLYINSVGEFLQIGITDNGANAFQILGMILYAKPAGRLTPGLFL